jgi:hypothetical protein
MTYLEAISFAIEDAHDNRKNAVDQASERLYRDMAATLERLEDDLIRLLEHELTPEQFCRVLKRQTSTP